MSLDARSEELQPVGLRRYDLIGYTVTYLHIDCRFTFDACAGAVSRGYLSVVIEVPFTIAHGEQVATFDPEFAATLGGALSILRRALVSLTAYRSGLLIIGFADGSRLTVEPQGPFTSWEAKGSGELSQIRFLCDGGTPLW